MSDPRRNRECGEPHPGFAYAKCVKPRGHEEEHAAPLGVHPANRYGPEFVEWGWWPTASDQPTDEQ